MESAIIYMYIFMVSILIIGFFMGWAVRRTAYKKRYEKRIETLEYEEEEKFEKLKKIEVDLEGLQNLYFDNKDSFRIKNERLNNYVDQESRVNRDISDIQKGNDRLLRDLLLVDDDINEALADLEKVKNARKTLLEQIDKANGIESEIAEIRRDIESIEMLVPPAFERKNELNRSSKNITERIKEKERDIDEVNFKIDRAKEEYARKKFSIDLELQEGTIEEENYKSILSKIEKKMEEGESLSKSDFEGVLHEKTSSWLDGLYKKSINLFKGEK
jgi:chromosome segregation ATPase